MFNAGLRKKKNNAKSVRCSLLTFGISHFLKNVNKTKNIRQKSPKTNTNVEKSMLDIVENKLSYTIFHPAYLTMTWYVRPPVSLHCYKVFFWWGGEVEEIIDNKIWLQMCWCLLSGGGIQQYQPTNNTNYKYRSHHVNYIFYVSKRLCDCDHLLPRYLAFLGVINQFNTTGCQSR